MGNSWATQFRAAPYRLRTATHRLPISSCGAAAKVAPHFHKAAALTCWGRSHSRIAAYLHGIRSFRVFFRSNAVAVSPLVMHISATTVNDRIIRAPWLCRPPAFCSLDLTSVAIKALARAEAEGNRDGLDSFYCGWGSTFSTAYLNLPSPVRMSAPYQTHRIGTAPLSIGSHYLWTIER